MSNPVRMCIVCRERFLKCQLLRLQHKNNKITTFSGSGRSFYVCPNCLENNKIIDYIIKTCKINKQHKEVLKQSLKEIFIYG